MYGVLKERDRPLFQLDTHALEFLHLCLEHIKLVLQPLRTGLSHIRLLSVC